MTPFEIKIGMPILEKNFNYRLSSARMSVENSFGRLKARWRILLKKPDVHVDTMRKIIRTCILLHNFCEMSKENVYERWMQEVAVEERQLLQQADPRNHPQENNSENIQDDSPCNNAKQVRVETALKLLRDNLSIDIPV